MDQFQAVFGPVNDTIPVASDVLPFLLRKQTEEASNAREQ
jgi:hypothetical protein